MTISKKKLIRILKISIIPYLFPSAEMDANVCNVLLITVARYFLFIIFIGNSTGTDKDRQTRW